MTEQPDEIVVAEADVEDEVSLLDPDHADDDLVESDDEHPANDDEIEEDV